MNRWPAGLPQRMNMDGFQEAMGDGRVFSENDVGDEKSRRRTTFTPRPVSGTMLITDAQLDNVLVPFVEVTLGGGVLPFYFPRQRSAAGDWIVKFSKDGLPIWTPVSGTHWRVVLNMMILP